MAKVLCWRNPDDYMPDSLRDKARFKNPNNKVYLEGIVTEDLRFEYKFNNVSYYKTAIQVKRPTGETDKIPIIMSESLATEKLEPGAVSKFVRVYGEYQSRNNEDMYGGKHVSLYVFVKQINAFERKEQALKGDVPNAVYLKGRVCKCPEIRGAEANIISIVLEVPRAEGITKHNDYINCVGLGKNANLARKLKYGDTVEIFGIIQSRKYLKKDNPDLPQGEYKTAYNVVIKLLFKC